MRHKKHVAPSRHTNNHNIEVEAFTDTLSVPLIWQVCKSNVSSELPSYNVPHIAGLLSCNLGIGRSDALRHLHRWGRTGLAVGCWRSPSRRLGITVRGYNCHRVSKWFRKGISVRKRVLHWPAGYQHSKRYLC